MHNEILLLNVLAFKSRRFDLITWYDADAGGFISLHPKQIKFFEKLTDNKTRWIGYGGGARGGKSIVLCLAALLSSFAYPGTAYLIGRKMYTILEITTKRTLINKIFPAHGLVENVHWHENKQTHVLTFNNGSEIIFFDTKDPPSDKLAIRFGSLEITQAFLDESNETTQKIVDAVYSRVGNRLNEKYEIMGKVAECFNPSQNHVRARYWEPFKNKEMPDNRVFIRALASDNPSKQAKNYVRQLLESGNQVMINRLVHGDFDYDDDPRILLDYVDIAKSFENNHVELLGEPCMSIDVATTGNDRFVILVKIGGVVIDGKIIPVVKPKDIPGHIDELKIKWNVPQNRMVYDAIGNGELLATTYPSARAFKGNMVNFWYLRRSTQNYRNVRAACMYLLAEQIQKRETWFKWLAENPEYKNWTTEELGQIKEINIDDPIKKRDIIGKPEMKEALGRSPDILDALSMFQIFEMEKLIKMPPMEHSRQ